MSNESKNLKAIYKAIDQHNENCDGPATAVIMNPFEVERLGWDSIRGLPILEDENLGTGTFRIICDKTETDDESEFEDTEVISDPDRETVEVQVSINVWHKICAIIFSWGNSRYSLY